MSLKWKVEAPQVETVTMTNHRVTHCLAYIKSIYWAHYRLEIVLGDIYEREYHFRMVYYDASYSEQEKSYRKAVDIKSQQCHLQQSCSEKQLMPLWFMRWEKRIYI